MTSAKKFLLILLSLSLVLLIASCGGSGKCDVCVDEDSDGVCDVCETKIEGEEVKDVVLIEDGETTFQIILPKNASVAVKQAVNTSIKSELGDCDIDVDVITEGSEDDVTIDCEILIGNIKSRGDKFFYDGHNLGKEGYAFQIVGKKVLISAGSDEQLVDAIGKFAKDILIPDDPTNVTMTKDDVVIKPQTDYKITALKVEGTDMRGYNLATELTREDFYEAALNIQDTLYTRTGYWFEIVDIEQATEKSFVIKSIPKVEGTDSFKILTNGTQLVIECAYGNMLGKAANRFIADNIITGKGELDFKGEVYKQDISAVYYEDFGASGDGKTDDFEAMYNTHVFANISGQTVKGKPGATYYVCNTEIIINSRYVVSSIPIQTNTDWQGARIIIDDRNIAAYRTGLNYELSQSHIFKILPDEEHEMIKVNRADILGSIVAAGLNPDTKNIDFKIDGWDGAMMIIPYNREHKVFRRRGYGGHSGEDMQEIIVIDKDGNVSEETPIMFEYTHINYIEAYKLDPESAIRVGNGIIETIETEQNHNVPLEDGTYEFKSGYKRRGISVTRSYTTVHDVEHIVSGGFNLKDRANGKDGSSSGGMFVATYANHVTFKDCIIPGRACYGNASTYNFSARSVNKIVLDGCIQSNFWITVDYETGEMTGHTEYVDGAVTNLSYVKMQSDSGTGSTLALHWGIGGTNYCKNMEYIDSQISRFDAHAGLYNGKIINTNINGMELTGVGDLIIENVNWYQYGTTVPFLYLRSDYGYHWDGHISVKDTKAYLYDITSYTPDLVIANHQYTNWYFGYTCAFPSLTFDNFAVYSMKTQTPMDYGFEARLFDFASSAKEMHIPGKTGQPSLFDYIDANKNGTIDEPVFDVNLDGRIDEKDVIDVDGDGVIGETEITVESQKDKTDKQRYKGIAHPDCSINLNVTKPPKFIKVINNTAGVKFSITNTAGKGTSDGGWYRNPDMPDTFGGFFGNTKFIYGTGEGEYFIGTDHLDQEITDSFIFVDNF